MLKLGFLIFYALFKVLPHLSYSVDKWIYMYKSYIYNPQFVALSDNMITWLQPLLLDELMSVRLSIMNYCSGTKSEVVAVNSAIQLRLDPGTLRE